MSITLDNAGRRQTVTLPNNVVMTYGYDPVSRISSIQYTKPDMSVLGGSTYSYDPAGNRTADSGSFARTSIPQGLTSATYDDANQLQQWVAASGTTTNFTYDLNGNLQSQPGTTYDWNARNQLRSILAGSSTVASFEYDGLGRRVKKTVNGMVSRYLYDGLNSVQELSDTYVATANVLTGLGIDEYFARTRVDVAPNVTSSFLTDPLGSTVALTAADGSLQTQYKYEPFGRTFLLPGATETSNPLHFTGRENDGTATNLYYYRARYYHPTFARFISEDSLGFRAGDANLYRYVFDSPVNLTDPLGLASCPRSCESAYSECLRSVRGLLTRCRGLVRNLAVGCAGVCLACPIFLDPPCHLTCLAGCAAAAVTGFAACEGIAAIESWQCYHEYLKCNCR